MFDTYIIFGSLVAGQLLKRKVNSFQTRKSKYSTISPQICYALQYLVRRVMKTHLSVEIPKLFCNCNGKMEREEVGYICAKLWGIEQKFSHLKRRKRGRGGGGG